MLLEKERQLIVEAGLLMYEKGYCQLTGGNISIFNRESGLVAIKPSGKAYIHMRPEDIIILDPSGNVVEGDAKPSIETPMHLSIYRNRPEMRAVVHCHPRHAVAYSLQHDELPYLFAAQYLLNGGVRVAPYEPIGTQELADSAVRAMGQDKNGCILQAHGVICASAKDVFEAFEMCCVIEEGCEIAGLCSPGKETFFIGQR